MVDGMNMSIEWHNGEITEAVSATDALKQLLNGWNPPTIPELKVVLAKRGNLPPPNNTETDEQFLQRLHDAGMFVLRND
jgi:hypothetical protein